jgi:uncharacterized protein
VTGGGWKMRRIIASILPLAVFGAMVVLAEVHPPLLDRLGAAAGHYGTGILLYSLFIAVPVGVLAVQYHGIRAALSQLGIWNNPLRPLFFGLVSTLPASIGFYLTGRISPSLAVVPFLLQCWYFPFAEEVLFRAFTFGQLYRRAGWNFFAIVIVVDAIFAAGHMYQSTDPAEIAGIVVVTGVGSAIFSYFFVRFGWNIWASFFLHALLNSWWAVFTANQNALGGWSDNIFRFASIGLAFALVLLAAKFRLFRIFAPRQGAWRSLAGRTA